MLRNRRYPHVLAALLGSLLLNTVQASDSNRVYDTNCAFCHQRDGAGLAGQFPRLAGRTGEIAATEAGRRYLIEVTLFGMAGKIDVDGTPIFGVMPSFVVMSDEDVASVLNYLVLLDAPAKSAAKTPLVSASDVKSVREAQQFTATQVHAKRAAALAVSKTK